MAILTVPSKPPGTRAGAVPDSIEDKAIRVARCESGLNPIAVGLKGNTPVVIMGGKQLELPRIEGRSWTDDFSFNFISDGGQVIAGSGRFTSTQEMVAIRRTCS